MNETISQKMYNRLINHYIYIYIYIQMYNIQYEYLDWKCSRFGSVT
jgi:hypothetical protein